MRTSLRLSLAALTAGLLAAPGAPPASAAQPACKPGAVAVRVTPARGPARTVCKAIPRARAAGPERLRARARAALPGARQLRAMLPRRVRSRVPLRRLTALERALDRATAARQASARAAANGPAGSAADCTKAPTFTVPATSARDGGVTAVAGGGGWATGSGSTRGQLVEVVAEAGSGMTGTQTTKTCISWDPCPDANGIVHGISEYAVTETYVASAGGATARVRTSLTMRARLTARVGDDARVRDYDWDADGATESGGSVTQNGVTRHVPTRMVRLHVRVRGADPRSREPVRAAHAVARGNRGAVTGNQLATVAALYQLATTVVSWEASSALLDAESGWNRGKCLTVVLTPEDPEVQPGQRVDVRIEVKRPDGAEANVPLELVPYDGAVGPVRGSSPMTVTWTAPMQLDRGSFLTFEVDVVSKQGKAEEFHHAHAARAAPSFRMTFAGDGGYTRHEMGDGLPQVDARHTFAWRSTTAIRFPYVDELPAGVPMTVNADATELTGELTGWRTDGAGRRGCSSAPDAASVVGVVRQTRTADGGFDVSISPFPWLVPTGGIQPECDSGAFLFWRKGVSAAMTFSFHLSHADLETKETIVVPATQQQPLAPDCDGGEANGDWPCEQAVSWSGSVRLDRVAPLPSR